MCGPSAPVSQLQSASSSHKSMTAVTSHGFSQPARASRRSTSAAVNPQMSIPRTRNAGLVRPSGTEPVIRVMGEADDQALVDALVSDVCDAVAGAA